MKGKQSEELLQVSQLDIAVLGQVALQILQILFVEIHEDVDSSLSDAEPRNVWEKVVSDDKADQHEVVYYVLQIPSERDHCVLHEVVYEFPHDADVHEYELNLEVIVAEYILLHLLHLLLRLLLLVLFNALSDHEEAWLVGGES